MKILIIGNHEGFSRFFGESLNDRAVYLDSLVSINGRPQIEESVIFVGEEFFNSKKADLTSLFSALASCKRVYLGIESPNIKKSISLLENFFKNNNVRGFVALDLNIECYPHLKSLLYEKEKELESTREALIDINLELSSLVRVVQHELQNAKELYHRLAPKRSQKIKDLTFVSQYSPGKNAGGEFFDYIQNNNQLFFLLSSCRSYIVSGKVLSLFASLKDQKVDKKSFSNFIKDLMEKIDGDENNIPANEKALDLFLLGIDLSTYAYCGVSFGRNIFLCENDTTLKGNDKLVDVQNIDDVFFEGKLSRANRYIILSRGLQLNFKNGAIDEELKENTMRDSNDILDALFYKIKRDRPDDYLDYDACAIIIEVDKNAIIQV